MIGFIWSIIWILFFTDSPQDHRYISTQEKEFILQNTQQLLSSNNKHEFHAPWRAILTSRACWALFVIHTCANYGGYTFLTSIPKYMSEILKFNIKSVSSIVSLNHFIHYENLEWTSLGFTLYYSLVEYKFLRFLSRYICSKKDFDNNEHQKVIQYTWKSFTRNIFGRSSLYDMPVKICCGDSFNYRRYNQVCSAFFSRAIL